MTGPNPILESLERDWHALRDRVPYPGFGHGHVTPRPDGAKARCGGPRICPQCAAELAVLAASQGTSAAAGETAAAVAGGTLAHDGAPRAAPHVAAAIAARTSQTPAPSPVNLAAPPAAVHPHDGGIMSLASDLKTVAERLDRLGEEVIGKTEAIVASPVGTAGFAMLHDLIGLNLDPAIVKSALGGLEALLLAYAPVQQAPQQQPAASAPAQA